MVYSTFFVKQFSDYLYHLPATTPRVKITYSILGAYAVPKQPIVNNIPAITIATRQLNRSINALDSGPVNINIFSFFLFLIWFKQFRFSTISSSYNNAGNTRGQMVGVLDLKSFNRPQIEFHWFDGPHLHRVLTSDFHASCIKYRRVIFMPSASSSDEWFSRLQV